MVLTSSFMIHLFIESPTDSCIIKLSKIRAESPGEKSLQPSEVYAYKKIGEYGNYRDNTCNIGDLSYKVQIEQ